MRHCSAHLSGSRTIQAELAAAQQGFPIFDLPVAYVGLHFTEPPSFPDFLEVPAHLTQAVAKRQNDYLAGRWCAYQLYQHFGLPWDGLPMHQNGAPIWPEDFCGSLSHTRGLAIAVMAPLSEMRSLGVDLEHLISAKTAQQVQKQILHPAEVANNLQELTQIFSAKESIYKGLNPLLKRFIGFEEVCFSILEPEQFYFDLCGPLVHDFPVGASQEVICFQGPEWVLTLYCLPTKKKKA